MSSETTIGQAAAILARAKELDSTAWAFDAEPDAYLKRRMDSVWQAKKDLNLP